jgi:hypothetical protein
MKTKKLNHITELRKHVGQIWQNVNNKTWKNSSVISTELSEFAITKSAVDVKNAIHKENYYSVGCKLYNITTKSERSFLIEKIAPNLKMNNAILPKPQLTERESRLFNKLIDKKIILRSGRYDFILINPEFVRRGSIINVVGSTYDKLKMAEKNKKCNLYVALKSSDAVSRNFSDEEEVLE